MSTADPGGENPLPPTLLLRNPLARLSDIWLSTALVFFADLAFQVGVGLRHWAPYRADGGASVRALDGTARTARVVAARFLSARDSLLSHLGELPCRHAGHAAVAV